MTKWLVLVLTSCLSWGVIAQERFIEGRDYVLIAEPVKTEDPSKVEVREVFWYGCPHCNTFRPVFDSWKKNQSADVDVQHQPAMWNRPMITHANIFYTAKLLGKSDAMHKDIFDAMHIKRQRLQKDSEIYALFEKHGVSREDFDKASKSFQVKTAVRRAGSNAKAYGITGTPELVVNGKYRISVNFTGSQKKMLEVADFLIAKERAALGS